MAWLTRLTLGLAVIGLLGACMRAGSHANVAFDDGPRADSVTTALWRMDETGGSHVADASPFRLDGTAGPETNTDFGRFNGARRFRQSLDSFVLVPDNPILEFPGSFTIEAWIRMDDYGWYETTPIVAKWTPLANEQSWFFGIVGYKRQPPASPAFSPGYLAEPMAAGRPGTVVLVFQQEEASLPRAFFSVRQIELGRWTHVAASYDGEIVRIYVNGQVEGQYAASGKLRKSAAPVLIGNLIDPRWLGSFGGDLRIEQPMDGNPYYAFTGLIDELRISSTARSVFSH